MARQEHVEDRPGFLGSRTASPAPAPIGQLPAFLAATPRSPGSDNDNWRHRLDHGPASELDCLRGVLPPPLLQQAEQRARRLGIGADRVLICWGVVDEVAYLQYLSRHTGIAVDDLTDYERQDSPLRDDQIVYAAATGIVPLRKDGRLILTLAPRNLTARAICRAHPSIRDEIRLTPEASFRQLLLRNGRTALTRQATRGLGAVFPSMSAAPGAITDKPWRGKLLRGCGVSAMILLPPFALPELWSGFLATWFLCFAALRLTSALWPQGQRVAGPPLSDDRLPAYTILAALYREAASVAPLMQAIDALDYPREKLDVILVVEPDDLQTQAAIAGLGALPHVTTLIAPAVAPKTKPKALNWALPFVRGSLVAVYDAEDRPDRGQLRAAVDAFRRHDGKVACVQASLHIDNEVHSWLSRGIMAQTPQDK